MSYHWKTYKTGKSYLCLCDIDADHNVVNKDKIRNSLEKGA